MSDNFTEGDYVHVPADSLLFDLLDGGQMSGMVKTKEPMKLMFLGEKPDPAFGDPLCEVFYGGMYMFTLKENVYAYKTGEENG